MMDAEQLMQAAIAEARRGIAAGQSPFGCAIARGERLLAARHNTVRSTIDATAHAEVNAIRTACRTTDDIHLTGAVVAATCEPCPMCLAALHWARVDVVYFGATIEDAKSAGFNELRLTAADMIRLGGSSLRLIPGLLGEECRLLFGQWRTTTGGTPY